MSKKKGIEGGFKGLMLRHMEKAIFAVVIVIFLLSIVKAVSHQKVDATPEQISQAAKTAETAVKNADQNYEPPAAQEIITEVAKADVAVDFIPYELQRTPVPGQSTGNLQKRGTPQVFAVRDLQTTPGNGAILVQREEEEFDPNATTSTMQVANNNQRAGMGGGMSGGMSGDMGMSGGMSGGMDMMGGGMSGGPGMMGGGMSGSMGSGMGMGGSMSEPKIVNWICVTGVIDFQKQMDEYNRCFEEAVQRYPERDMYPVYSYFTIERAEVDASNPTAEPKWESIDLAKAFEPLFLEWSGFSMEAADASMTTLGLPFVYPLPVLSGGKWSEEVAHLPEIPLMDFTSRQYTMGGFGMQQQTTTVRNAKGKKTEETKAVFDPKAIYTKLMQNQDLLRKSGRTSGMGGMGGMGGGYGSGMMSGGMSGGYGGGMSGGMSGGSGMGGGTNNPLVSGIRSLTSMGRNAGRGGMGGMSGGYGGGMSGGMGMGSGMMGGARGMYANAEYQLFRFFDFQVKPGTNYTYRVRLELENPNYKIPVDYLEDDKSGQDEYLLSAWSNDTGGTKVVGDSQILLGMTDPETKENPKVPTLILVKMDEDTGKPQLHRVQPSVGQVLNLKGAEIVETQQQGRYASMMGSGPGMMGPGMSGGPGGRNPKTTAKKEKPKTTDFVSERLFVGANMGPKLSTSKGEHYGPTEVLLMDPDGHLVCLREDDDEAEYLRHFPKGRTVIPEPNKQKQQPGRGSPGMGGPGMMGGPSSM